MHCQDLLASFSNRYQVIAEKVTPFWFHSISFFFQTFLCNALFVVLVPIYEAITWLRKRSKNTAPAGEAHVQDYDAERAPLVVNAEERDEMPTVTVTVSRVKTLWLAARILPLWFVAQWSFNVSLSMTSVTSNTIISSTASLWTLVLATLFAGETFTWLKLLGVMCCVGGTAIVSVGDSASNSTAANHSGRSNSSNSSNSSNGGSGHEALYGNMICLGSTVVYACYTAALRRWGSSKDCSMMLMFGYVGLLSIIVVGPVVLLFGKLGTVRCDLLHPAAAPLPWLAYPPRLGAVRARVRVHAHARLRLRIHTFIVVHGVFYTTR